MLKESLFVRACRGETVERTPIWVMRQAGRYLPEYRDVRGKTTFLGLCKTPELAAEVTLQPIRRFGLDAAIIFSDILIPVEAMGVPLDFDPAPKLGARIESEADIDRLVVPDPVRDMRFVLDAIRGFRSAMPDVPLIGFAGAPFTLMAYLVEGGGSKGYERTKTFAYQHPRWARKLLSKLSETVANHLLAQVEAGCAAVQIFDSWAGHLSPDDYASVGLPFIVEIIDRLSSKDVPIIVFAKGAHGSLDRLAQSGAHVLGVDWTTPLDLARTLTNNAVVLQGNLDPVALFGPPEHIERQVQRILNEAQGGKGHIFNLGHGILPETPVAHMGALVDAVKRLGVRRA